MTNAFLPVQISSAGIAGWPNAFAMSNGFLSVTIAPDVARVIQCSFAGKDLFFVNEFERGRVYLPSDSAEWHNFGGMRFDAAPQAAWAETSWKTAWPPPPVLNSGRTGEISGSTYVMGTGSEVPNHLEVGIKTWIDIMPGSTLMETRTELTGLGEGRVFANWVVAQFAAKAGNSTIYLPSAESSHHELGYGVQMQPASGSSPIKSASSLGPIAFTYEGIEWKFGFDGRGWIALRPDDGDETVVAMIGDLKANRVYPDDNSSVEFYSAGHMPYVELELLGPVALLCRGDTVTDTFRMGVAKCPGQIVFANRFGVSSRRFEIVDGRLFGTYGSFYKGILEIVGETESGESIEIAKIEISPERAIVVDAIDIDAKKITSVKASILNDAKYMLRILDILRIKN